MLGPRADAIPLVDLRPLGAPVASYAVRVHKLIANGEEMPLTRPCVAVIDTGTTGLVISESLYDSDEFPLPGAAVRSMDVQALTEAGRVVTLSAARRRRDDVSLDAPSGTATMPGPPPSESFPLITTPVALRWFDGRPLPPGEEAPHVLCLGLVSRTPLHAASRK